MESLKDNRPLLYGILFSGGVVLALTLGIIPELAAQFEIIDFPSDVSIPIFFLQILIISFSVPKNTIASPLCGFLFLVPRGQIVSLAVRRRQVISGTGSVLGYREGT